MCGIAGFVSATPTERQDAVLRRMGDVIRHRGPDDAGYYVDEHAHLAHRRLSIIDLAGGRQPMFNETGALAIIYNGEIFNHAAIRPELERAGHRYATRCDTETILHAYEEWGPACLSRFRGMFAFAIWDAVSKTLFCARDRLGKKPFYYFWDGRLFVFASEIKALLEHPAVSVEVEDSVLAENLGFGFTSDDRTLFRGIKKLLPGHYLTFETARAEPRIAEYWDVPQPGEDRQNAGCRGEHEWIAEVRRRLEETVEMRLMSDVPLGMFLSGGVDSSAIAAIMKRRTDGPVKTFSVGYREAQFSELNYAAEVARAIGTDHHEIVIGLDDFFGALPRLVWHEDEPIAWPSSVSLYFVSRLASEQVKVVLTGEGSDELFGGYERYLWNMLNARAGRVYRFVPGPLRRLISGQLDSSPLLKASLRRKLRHTFLGRDGAIESIFLDNFYCGFSREELGRLLASDGARMYAGYLALWNSRPHAQLLPRMLYADQKTYLVELLMKQDQMSMACSIESRVPFLDHEFAEFAMTIPDNLKIRGRTQKYILKKAVEDLLPHDIVYRKKMGFPTPLRRWLMQPETEPLFAALAAPDGLLASYIDISEMNSLLERHRAGLVDATDRIWRLMNLQIWGDLFITGKPERWSALAAREEAAPSAV